MKNLSEKLIPLLLEGCCTPQIARIATKLKEPSTTIHYNIKKLEEQKTIKAYKAVFDYKKIDKGHCTYLLGNLGPEHYSNPEKIAEALAKHPEVESVDIVTGDYELLIKLRTKDIDTYYAFVKFMVKQYAFAKTYSITSLKQVKTEFVQM